MKLSNPTQEPTLLQHYLSFLIYAKPSTPTNIGQSHSPKEPATYQFASFLDKPPTQKPTSSCHTHYTIVPPPTFPAPPCQFTTLLLPYPLQHVSRSGAKSCIYTYSLWQYTLNTTQPSMNQRVLRSLHYRAHTRAHTRHLAPVETWLHTK